MVAALLLGLATPSPASAATSSKGANLTDIQYIYDTTPLNGRRFVAVGCDATPSRVGRIQVIDLKAGRTAWQDSVAGSNGCFYAVVATPSRVFVWGIVDDSDGDGGRNLLVEAYDAKTGAVVWQQDIEAPNPKQSITRPTIVRPNMTLLNSKLVIFTGSTGSANPMILFRLDANTGALLPANP